MISASIYAGAGNRFAVIDSTAATAVTDRPAVGARVCEELDVDGTLFLQRSPRRADDDAQRVRMTLVQPDGGTAAMCGNGARCAAVWVSDRTGADRVVIETPAGDRPATVDRDSGDGPSATVEMGRPSFAPDDVPLDRDRPLIEERVGDLTVTAVSTGVPHAVAFVADVADVTLSAVAPDVRHASVFPDGANVTLAARRTDAETPSGPAFDQRTFERGVEGETEACGTGAVAIVAAARRTDRLAGTTATVYPPGGVLTATVPDDGPATLAGPVTRGPTVTLDPDGAVVAVGDEPADETNEDTHD